jgi:hypothetical protein
VDPLWPRERGCELRRGPWGTRRTGGRGDEVHGTHNMRQRIHGQIHPPAEAKSNPLVKSIVSLSWLEQKHHGGGPEEEEPAVEKLAQERMPRVRLGSGACAEPTATCSRALPLHPNPASATAGETKAVTMRGG